MAEKLISAEFTKRLAERLIKDEEECYNTSPKSWAEEIENFKHLIDSIPAVEAKPIVHAHWEKPTCINGRAFSIYHCSACGEVPCGIDNNTKYCPNCGAQMDEVVEK